MDKITDVQFGCAFCDVTVPKEDLATFTLSWKGVEQYWFGHAKCFATALHKDYRTFRDEWGFEVTKTGRVLDDKDIEALADEAERGYDLE